MKICIIGHSLIANRQKLFCEAIRLLGHQVLEIYPSKWYHLDREGGYPISGASIENYYFNNDTLKTIKNFKPDILYSMTEWWQEQAAVSLQWSKHLKVPLALFCWENIRQPNTNEISLIRECSLVVCGNSDAERIVKPYNEKTIRLTQVGIDHFEFYPMENFVKIDLGFVGRPVPEKGIEHILELEKEFKILKTEMMGYLEMPKFYNQIKLLVVPSLDIPTWREQWPACIAEALACKVPVVAFDSGNIREHYGTCKAVSIVEQGDIKAMKKEIRRLLDSKTLFQDERLNIRWWARQFAVGKFSNDVVAGKLVEAFEKCISAI